MKTSRNKLSRSTISVIVIMIAAAIAASLSAIRYGIPFSPDTWTYVDAYDSLRNGEIDMWRTPLFPAIIGLCKAIAGDGFGWLIVALQIAVFVATIPLFYKFGSGIISRKGIAVVATAVYAAIVVESGFCQFILSESLAGSLTVIIIYFADRFIRNRRVGDAVALSIAALLIVALRPAQAYIPAILAVLAIAMIIKSFRNGYAKLPATILAVGMCIIAISTAVYAYAFKARYGVESVTCVGTFNNYYTARFGGLITPESACDYEIKADIERNIATNGIRVDSDEVCWAEITELIDRHSLLQVDETVKAAIAANRAEWYDMMAKRALTSGIDYRFPATWIPQIQQRLNPISLPMGVVYLAIIAFAVIIVFDIRKKRPSLLNLVILAIVTGNFAVAIFAAKDDLDRLVFPSSAVVISIIFVIIDRCISVFHKCSKPKQNEV